MCREAWSASAFDDPEAQASMAPSTDRPTWLRSDRFLARSVARPVNRFLHIEASGGVLLAGAALIALVWANSPGPPPTGTCGPPT